MNFWHCGSHRLPLGHKTYIMGIVNVTPDSFSGDGRSGEAALQRALRLVEEGADLLDIGGESTRPGAAKIGVQQELDRVMPLISALASLVNVPLSIDTTKAAVAQAALQAGASIVNDISGATFDEAMLATVAATDAGLILMHLRGASDTMGASQKQGGSEDVIAEVLEFWGQRTRAALALGIGPERIALDAGFGFGKSVAENLELLRHGKKLAALGYPTLSGTSRKSTIGKLLGEVPVEARLWGTAATVALAIANGADVVRVHDVLEMAQVARVADALR